MFETLPSPTRAAALAAACMSCWAFAACGDSEDKQADDTVAADEAGGNTTAQPSTTTPAPDADGARSGESSGPKGGTAESRITEIVEGLYGDIAAGNAAGVCSAMSEAAQEQIAQNVPGGSTETPAKRTCEKSFSTFLTVAKRNGALQNTGNARVTKVSIDGPVATVTVSFGDASGEIKLQKVKGAWKFGVGAFASGAAA